MAAPAQSCSVLIVGAGPTGLVLAISLARRGIHFRLIDDDAGPGAHSRAVVVQARTLEFYRQFGFAQQVIDAGVIIENAHLREGSIRGGGETVVDFSLKDLGEGLSPYPFALAYPQDDHERLLVRKLTEGGIRIDWNTKLSAFEQDKDGVRATLLGPNGVENIRADYLCGCDGAHSIVRKTLNMSFPGGTYPQLYYVADVKLESGFDRDLTVNLGTNIFALLLPVRSTGMQRLIGLIPEDVEQRTDLSFENIRAQIEPLVNVKISEVNWFSTYRVQHRVAEHFQVGRAFLLGDAGHLHSPAGGQGMNTGIGDAINLGWKLAEVVRAKSAADLLDTYELERIGFARRLVATTDRAFKGIVASGLRGEFVRRLLVPAAFTLGTHFEMGRHAFFKTLSQTTINYRDSPLSEGQAGDVRGGDRLPWVGGATDNFAPLNSLDWQVHVYGEPESEVKDMCASLDIALHLFPWSQGAEDAGLDRDALYLVRPDGHVALAAENHEEAEVLEAFIARMK